MGSGAAPQDEKVFYITTPIYYLNGLPHIGHSYTTVAADALARFWRQQGRRVLFATGTDEHGQKVYRASQEAGLEPQEYVDRLAEEWIEAWQRCHINYDEFIRTSYPHHMRVVQEVFSRLQEAGDIYLGTYEGWYCMACETYFREEELEEGHCPDCGRAVEKVAERAYFFATSKYAQPLLNYIAEHPDFIQPEQRRKEVLSFIERGLLDVCISRQRSPWDIPVPGDETQSIYVWFDALINYLTVAGYLQDEEKFAQTWPPDVQLMGKDILPRFHASIWPAMLMALDLPLPKRLVAHGWWMTASEDRSGLAKMSKSAGNVIDPLGCAEALAEVAGADEDIAVDAVRYYLLREVTFGLDGVFSMDSLLERFNADLANDLGNLLNRTLPLVSRGFERKIPEPGEGAGAMSEQIDRMREAYERDMAACDFRAALEAIWELVRAANKFVDTREPWGALREGKMQEAAATLYDVLDVARVAAVALEPVMPAAAREIWRQLGLEEAGVEMKGEDLRAGALPAGVVVHKPRPIFPRIDLKKVREEAQKKAEAQGAQEKSATGEAGGAGAKGEAAEKGGMVSFQEFSRLDLRVGEVVEAERVKGADKLLRVLVDLGEGEPRQIVAGLAPYFGPEDLVGKSIVVVANLEPATIKGVESRGMLLAAGEEEPLALLVPDRDCPPGTKVR